MIALLLQKVRHAFAVAPIASAVFAVALIASVFFGVRTAVLSDTHPWIAASDRPVAAWMTPRFIARSKDVPLDMILEALALELEPGHDGRPPTLGSLAETRGVPVQDLIDTVETEVRAFHEDRHPAVGQ